MIKRKINNKYRYDKKVLIGGKLLRVSCLTSEIENAIGYQHCAKPPMLNKQGLLFDFKLNQQRHYSFHMRNVYFDLDVLCFDGRGFFIESIRKMRSPYIKTEDGSIALDKRLYNTVYTTRKPGIVTCIEVLAGYRGTLIPGVTRLRFVE